MTASYTLMLLPERYAVVKLAPGTVLDTKGGIGTELLAIIHTSEETTVVCKEGIMFNGKAIERNWRVLKIAGSLDFKLVGVLASLLTPLAEAGVSVYTLSTYSTDMILVKGNRLKLAISTLKKAGHQILE